MKKLLVTCTTILLLSTQIVSAQTILPVAQGGTGWGRPGGILGGNLIFGNWLGRLATSSDITFSTSTRNLAFTNGSTTRMGVSAAMWFTGLTGPAPLAITSTGLVYAAATTTAGNPSGSVGSTAATNGTANTYMRSDAVPACTQATASVPGCLAAADFTTFANKINFANLFSLDSNFGTAVISTTTILWMKNGIHASSTSQFVSASSSALSASSQIYTAKASTTALVVSGVQGKILATDGQGNVSGTTTIDKNLLSLHTISGIELGSNLAALTVSGTLTGTSYNGSAAVSDLAINLNNANTWTALQKFSGAGTTTIANGLEVGTLVGAPYFNATSTTATSTFKGGIISNILNCGQALETDTVGNIICGTDSTGGGGYPFNTAAPYNSTSTLVQFTGGITAMASSTIGSYTSTTTLLGNVMIGNSALSANILGSTTPFQVSGSYNSFMQTLLWNTNAGSNASNCLVFNNNLSPASNNAYFGELCFDSGSYSQPVAFPNERPNELVLSANDGGIGIMAASTTLSNASSSIWLATRGTKRFEILQQGQIVAATSTPAWGLLTLASSTGPQLTLVDGTPGNVAWSMRAVSGNFFFATSTQNATSTIASFMINGRTGVATFASILSSGNAGVGTSTPWGRLSVQGVDSAAPLFTVATSTGGQTLFSLNVYGSIQTGAIQPATSSAQQINWSTTPPLVEIQMGVSAMSINIIQATTSQYWGSRKVVTVCNGASTAGALTWGGVEWIGTPPTQTTTGNTCDVYSFIVIRATSTTEYKVAGTAGTGFK